MSTFDDLRKFISDNNIAPLHEGAFQKKTETPFCKKNVKEVSFAENMPMRDYHEIAHCLSSSMLSAATSLGDLVRYVADKGEKKCFDLGTVFHELVSGGNGYMVFDDTEVINDILAIKDTKRPRSTKEYSEAKAKIEYKAESRGLPLITADEFKPIKFAAKAIFSNENLQNIINVASKEYSIFADFGSFLVKTRPDLLLHAITEAEIDFFNETFLLDVKAGDVIYISLKTTQKLDWFANDCMKFGYDLKEAFYHDILGAVYENTVHSFILCSEISTAKYNLYHLSENFIEQGRQKYVANLGTIKKCCILPSAEFTKDVYTAVAAYQQGDAENMPKDFFEQGNNFLTL